MRTLIWFQCITVATVLAEIKYHTCVPSGFAGYCTLHYVYFNQSDTAMIHHFPQNYSRIRIGAEYLDFENEIPYFDVGLYNKLGRPRTLEVLRSMMVLLEIPRELREGRFLGNSIKYFWVEEGETTPALVYLDLFLNELDDLRNVSHFVNLETLRVPQNNLQTIEPDTFRHLTKLKYLCMNYNNFLKISLLVLPASLTHLSFGGNLIEELDYNELRFPSMVYLDLEDNQLSKLDAAELLLAMPKLRAIRLRGNLFEQQDILPAIEIFKRFNVSYKREADDLDPVIEPPNSVIGKIFCSLVVILFSFVGILVVRLVFVAMNK